MTIQAKPTRKQKPMAPARKKRTAKSSIPRSDVFKNGKRVEQVLTIFERLDSTE